MKQMNPSPMLDSMRFSLESNADNKTIKPKLANRHRAQQELYLSEQSWLIAMDMIGEAVITTDRLGVIKSMNYPAERLTGWRSIEAVGRPLGEIYQLRKELTRDTPIDPMELVIERGQLVGLATNAELVSRDGRKYKISDCAAPIYDRNKRILGVILVFSDVTEDSGLRHALSKTTELLDRTAEVAKIGAWEFDLRTGRMVGSRQACRMLDVDPAELCNTAEQNLDVFTSDFQPLVDAAIKAATDDGKAWDMELPMTSSSGRHFWARVMGQAIFANGEAVRLNGTLQDVTERHEALRFEQFRSTALELLVSDVPVEEILASIVLGIEQLHPAMLCSVTLLQEDGWRMGKCIAPSLPNFYTDAFHGLGIGIGVGSCGTAMLTGERCVVANIATHPYWRAYKDLAARAGLGACWSQAIRASSGVILGALAVYHRQVREPNAAELAFISKSVQFISIAIERGVAGQKLRASENRFRKLFENNQSVMLLSELETGDIIDANRAATTFYGHPEASLVGMNIRDVGGLSVLEHADGLKSAAQLLGRNPSIVHRLANGDMRDVEVYSTVIEGAGLPLVFSIVNDVTERVQGQCALQKSNARYDNLVSKIPIGIYQSRCTAEGVFSVDYVSPKAAELMDIDALNVLADPKNIYRSIHPEDLEDFAIVSHSSTETRRPFDWRGRFLVGDETRWLHVTSTPEQQTNGDVLWFGLVVDITEQKVAEDQAKSLAFYDPLTGLPNRRLHEARTKQALSNAAIEGRKGALLIVDMDNFKTINDMVGHYGGDLLLKQIAGRITASVGNIGTVAHTSDDEFVVVLEDLGGDMAEAALEAETVAKKILANLNGAYQVEDRECHLSGSIGFTLFGESHEDVDAFFRKADLALHHAKGLGRGSISQFEPAMQVALSAKMMLDADLRKAISNQEFSLHYQAQVGADGGLKGTEALLRWNHPQRGTILPGEFIQLAEETGLILPLGDWVLETACAQLVRWASTSEMTNLKMSVNISAKQFHQHNFVAKVLSALERSGANPNQLKLELTESMLVTNIEEVIIKMNCLQKVGITFALDDFGTGYSSLSYLARLPLDQLKIDQSFVREMLLEPNVASIARTVVRLGDSLGLEVIAEGVETEAQRTFLIGEGCNSFQGYLYGVPLPAKEFDELARRLLVRSGC